MVNVFKKKTNNYRKHNCTYFPHFLNYYKSRQNVCLKSSLNIIAQGDHVVLTRPDELPETTPGTETCTVPVLTVTGYSKSRATDVLPSTLVIPHYT